MTTFERRVRAMGSNAHIIVVGGPDELIDRCVERLADLESKWSRFLPSSEISTYNASGRPWRELDLSTETRRLLERSEEGSVITDDRFDPWILKEMHEIGYSLPLQNGDHSLPSSPPRHGFDPGGIGKGLAADILVEFLVEAGASGALVNLGGDVRVAGSPDDGGPWRIDIEDPVGPTPLMAVALNDGAVATSTPLKRRWATEHGDRHHLIDPAKGTSSDSPVLAVTVIAREGWQAEVLCKMLYLDSTTNEKAMKLVEELECAALVVTPNLLATSSRWSDYEVPRVDTVHA